MQVQVTPAAQPQNQLSLKGQSILTWLLKDVAAGAQVLIQTFHVVMMSTAKVEADWPQGIESPAAHRCQVQSGSLLLSLGPVFDSRLRHLQQSFGLGSCEACLRPINGWQVHDNRLTAYTFSLLPCCDSVGHLDSSS